MSEKRILERRVAELRLVRMSVVFLSIYVSGLYVAADVLILFVIQAYDQQQQGLVDAASKALSYRQNVLEENIRLTYALQVLSFCIILVPLLVVCKTCTRDVTFPCNMLVT